MKQTWKVGAIVLACLQMVGCHPGESERLAEMADRTVQMQAEQNTAAAKANQDFVELNSKLQTESMRTLFCLRWELGKRKRSWFLKVWISC